MTAAEIIALVNAGISGLEILIPKLQLATSKGEVTVAQQNELLSRIDEIRTGAAFNKPHWKPDQAE
jgi:hypothetical protein